MGFQMVFKKWRSSRDIFADLRCKRFFFNWGSLGFLKLEINWDITGIYLLAGGAITILKNMEKCLKPQTSILYI